MKLEAGQSLVCELCQRTVSGTTRHHLVPKSEGGTITASLCSACHRTLHRFFTSRTLAKDLSSIEALRRDPEIARYLAWVRTQPDRAIRARTSKKRR
ncbi:MAG TPA: HNH endonuclease [Aggregatilineales bacterium]|nr:HNH endonuclease [Aggregatilineales bacterium]